ncbi:MAG: glycosyl hydrolase 108 family protein, partial [Desulfovibrio piger]
MPDNDNSFSRAHAFTAHWEGGFSDHPADNGGLTAYGASLKFVKGIAATQQGRDFLQRIGFRLPVNKASMRSVTPDMARAMFKREFWDRLRLDDMPF